MTKLTFLTLCSHKSKDWLFWSYNQTWNTSKPDFTLCFQYTILNWIPLAFLVISCIFYVPMLLNKKTIYYSKRGTFNISKLILIAILFLIHCLNLCNTISAQLSGQRPPTAQFLQPILSGTFALFLIYVNCLVFTKGVHSSSILFIYWTLQLLDNLIIVYSRFIRLNTPSSDRFLVISASMEFLIVLLCFLLNCFSDLEVVRHVFINPNSDILPDKKLLLANKSYKSQSLKYPISPEVKASFLSKIIFSWPTKLVYRGFRKPLTMANIYSLTKNNTCSKIVPLMDSAWERGINRTNKPILNTHKSLSLNDDANDSKFLDHEHDKTRIKEPSFLRALFYLVAHKFIFAGFLRVLYDLTNFIQIEILQLLIDFVGKTNNILWHGFFYIIIIFVVSMTRTFLNQHFQYNCSVIGMNVRTAAISIIYKKALRLSLTSRKERTVGEIVNLMAVDASKFQEFSFYFHILWVSPIAIAISIYLLWQELGPAIFAGLAVMLCFIILNAFIGSKVKKLQMQQMKLKDGRMKLINEILNGIKILKLFAWETYFKKNIQNVRERECKVLRKAMLLNTFNVVSIFCTPPLVTLISFGVYVLSSSDNILTPQKIFVSIALFNVLNYPLAIIPNSIAITIQGLVAAKRINSFLNVDELNSDNIDIFPTEEPIKIMNGNFSWKEVENPILKNININVKEGSLVMVVGPVGSGKSSLLNAILGEMNKISGIVKRREPIAFVPQQPWCQNRSLQDNILFGNPMVHSKYDKVLEACALLEDLEMLPAGDLTEIGEKGINLSGGQKLRISLARAVYQDCSIYLLDDPLSAVDVNVGNHIFEEVLGPNGILSNTTRLLVTHRLTFLSKADQIIVMDNGSISEIGTYRELLERNSLFSEFIKTYSEIDEKFYLEDSTRQELKQVLGTISCGDQSERKSNDCITRKMSPIGSSSQMITTKIDKKCLENKKLITEEYLQIGGIKAEVLLYYIRSGSCLLCITALLCYLLFLATHVCGNMILSSWSEVSIINETQNLNSRDYFLGIYGGLAFFQVIAIIIQNLSLAFGMFLASKSLHKMMLQSVLRAPAVFFDTTPIGRILNRIGKDIDTVDVMIPIYISNWLSSGSRVICTILIICIASPYLTIALLPLSFMYLLVQRFYIRTMRQLQRLDAIKRSPIYSHFQESIIGVSSIRAYKVSKKFIDKCEALTDENQMVAYLIIVCNRWMQFYLELIGNIIILLVGIFGVLFRDSMGPGLAGLSISYVLMITTSLAFMVRTSCEIESNIVSIERIKEYSEIESEAPWNIEKTQPPFDWPSKGKIEFHNYSVRYRPGLELALRNLNFVVESGEKFGIVGRTGAGKSSLTLALFRLIEPDEGSIKIDDIDISTLGLHELRSKINIIPQDPVLFSGTLRVNLDPFDEYSDEELWIALKIAHLKEFFTQTNLGLNHEISENGENLSVGQRQLVCLARAALRKSKILVLDEATAAVDMETDELIQNSIRTEFKSSTVLIIAHRLNTIMDCDRVMVIQQGVVEEINNPKELLANENSIFYDMAKGAGIV